MEGDVAGPIKRTKTVSEPSNSSLVARCLDGDARAWEAIVHRFERLVYAIAGREGLNSDQAAEVTQHAFGELVRQLPDLRDPERLGDWLSVVARREVWRIRREATAAHSNRIAFVVDQVAEDFSELYAMAAAVQQAVQALGEPCRSMITALFFDESEPDYRAISRAIGRPIGSIGPLRSRCLERLRALLLEQDADGPNDV